MLLFCPACSNMLTISVVPQPLNPTHRLDPSVGKNRFECRTCPYQYVLDKPYFETKHFPRGDRKQASEILSGADAIKNSERVEVTCKNEKCNNREAAVMQVQIRSADEPMTSFFTCTVCGQKWREN